MTYIPPNPNGSATSANSSPVVIASDQSAINTGIQVAGAAVTTTNPVPIQPPASGSLAVDVQKINSVTPLMGNGVTGTGSQRVTIASDNTAFSVNANAGTNLNTSALNLETTQTAMSAKLPATLGQKAMTASMAVVLASDQASVPVAATLTAETTKVIGTTRTLGNAGAVIDGVNTAATAPANGVLGLGIYNSTEPSPTTGQSVGVQVDSKGRARGVIMDAAGNTRGANVTAANAVLVDLSATTANATAVKVNVASAGIASGAIASGAIASGAIASGAVASGAVASGAFAAGSISVGAITKGATSMLAAEDDASADLDYGVKNLAVRKATPANTSGTDGDYEMLQMSAGRLWASTNVDSINGVTPLMGNGATGTGALRVSIASDSTGIVQPVTGTTGGTSFSYAVSAATNNKTQAKGSAGQVYSISVQNISSAPVYLKMFDNTSAGVTAGTTAASYQFMCPANATAANGAGIVHEFPLGMAHATGITWMLTTGIGSTDNTSTAANIAIVTIGYK